MGPVARGAAAVRISVRMREAKEPGLPQRELLVGPRVLGQDPDIAPDFGDCLERARRPFWRARDRTVGGPRRDGVAVRAFRRRRGAYDGHRDRAPAAEAIAAEKATSLWAVALIVYVDDEQR